MQVGGGAQSDSTALALGLGLNVVQQSWRLEATVTETLVNKYIYFVKLLFPTDKIGR